MRSGILDSILGFLDTHPGLDTAAKSAKQQILQLAPRLRPLCAGITFEGRVDFYMEEIWKPVMGFEGFYEVSSLGRVRICKVMKPGKRRDGYFGITFRKPGVKKQMLIHAVVLEAFKGPRPFGQVGRHLDGVKSHNYPDNLEWGTYLENRADSIAHGTANRGERHGNSKLTNEQICNIRALQIDGVPNRRIAFRFGVTPSTIGYIVKRKTWRHV